MLTETVQLPFAAKFSSRSSEPLKATILANSAALQFMAASLASPLIGVKLKHS
jgi:hypothetical protein